jgi:hypothetical protein
MKLETVLGIGIGVPVRDLVGGQPGLPPGFDVMNLRMRMRTPAATLIYLRINSVLFQADKPYFLYPPSI